MNIFQRPTPTRLVYQGQHRGHEVVIRHLEKGDVSALHRYINELSQERTFITFQGEHITLKDERAHVADMIKGIKKHQLVKLLMFVDGICCGSSEIIMDGRVSAHRGSLGLSIARHVRAVGLGQLFLQSLIDEAIIWIPNLRLIQLSCFATNEVALKLYKKLGFIESGRIVGAILYKGEYIDEIIMTLATLRAK